MARHKRSKTKRRHHHHHRQPTRHEEKILDDGVSHRTSCSEDVSAEQSPRPISKDVDMPESPSRVDQLKNRDHRLRSALSTPPASITLGGASTTNNDGLDTLLEGLTGSDLRTATLVVQALRAPEDLSRLRRLAVTHGFVNDRIRSVVWPRLLGIFTPGAHGLALGRAPSPPLPYGSRGPRSQLDSTVPGHPPLPPHSYSGQQERPTSLLVAPPPPPGPSIPRRLDDLCVSCPVSPQNPREPPPAGTLADSPGDGQRPLATAPTAQSAMGCEPPAVAAAAAGAVSSGPGAQPEQDSDEALAGMAANGDAAGCPGEPQSFKDVAGSGSGADGARTCDAAKAACGVGGSYAALVDAVAGQMPGAALRLRMSSGGSGDSMGGMASREAALMPKPHGLSPERPACTGVSCASGRELIFLEEPDGGLDPPSSSATEVGARPASAPAPGHEGQGHEGPGKDNAAAHGGGGGGRPCGGAGEEAGDGAGAHRPNGVNDRHNGTGPSCIQVSGGGNGESLASSLAPTPAPAVSASSGDWGCERGCNSFASSGCGWEWDWQQYVRWSDQPHRDSSVVEVDVARSLWSFTRGLSDQERDARRQQLKRLLNALVAAHAGDVFYYQGLHDVAGVLLLALSGPANRRTSLPGHVAAVAAGPLTGGPRSHSAPAATARTQQGARRHKAAALPHVAPAAAGTDASAATTATKPASTCGCGTDAHHGGNGGGEELLAFALLRQLATTHLRDATRPSLEPVVQLLGLVPYLVRAADPTLGRHLAKVGLQPFFALSWFLTWWAHELDDLPPAARLFDFFLASHPLMPLYLGAVAMRSQRVMLLSCEDMPELHSTLTNLKLVRSTAGPGVGGGGGRGGAAAAVAGLKLDELLRQAEQLWRAKPPHTLAPMRPGRTPPSLPSSSSSPQLRRRRGGGGLDDAADAAGAIGSGRRSGGGEEAGLGLALTACVAHAARMEGRPGMWQVPREPPVDWPDAATGAAMEGRSGLAGMLSRASSAFGGRSRTAFLSTALLAGVYVAAAVAIGYATFARSTGGQQ